MDDVLKPEGSGGSNPPDPDIIVLNPPPPETPPSARVDDSESPPVHNDDVVFGGPPLVITEEEEPLVEERPPRWQLLMERCKETVEEGNRLLNLFVKSTLFGILIKAMLLAILVSALVLLGTKVHSRMSERVKTQKANAKKIVESQPKVQEVPAVEIKPSPSPVVESMEVTNEVTIPIEVAIPIEVETFTTNITVVTNVVSSRTNGIWTIKQVATTNVVITSNRADNGLKWQLFWMKPPYVSGLNPKARTPDQNEVIILTNNTAVFAFTLYFKDGGVQKKADFFWDKTQEYGVWSQASPKGEGTWWLAPEPGSSNRYQGVVLDRLTDNKFINMWLVGK